MIIKLDEEDAEAVIIEARLSPWDLLVDTDHALMRRGLKRDLVEALRLAWIQSKSPRRADESFGVSGAVDITVSGPLPDPFPAIRPEVLHLIAPEHRFEKPRLEKVGVRTLRPRGSPDAQYRFAQAVFEVSLVEHNIRRVAKDCHVSVPEAALYVRHFARLLAEVEMIGRATDDDAIELWADVWGLRPELLSRPWTKSPPRMFEILAGKRFPSVAP